MTRQQMMDHLTQQFHHFLRAPVTELVSSAERNPHGSGNLMVYEPHMVGDGRMVGLQPRLLDDYPERVGDAAMMVEEQQIHIQVSQEEADEEIFHDALDGMAGGGGGGGGGFDMSQILAGMAMGDPNMTVAQMLREMGQDANLGGGGDSLLGAMYSALAESLPLTDLLRIVNGDTAPLDANRNRIRRYLIENVLNGNDRPSPEDLRNAAARLAAADASALSGLIREAPGRRGPDGAELDVEASLNACEQSAMEDCLLIVFGHDAQPEGSQFGQRLRSRAVRFLSQILALGQDVCEGGLPAFLDLIRRYTQAAGVDGEGGAGAAGLNPMVSNMMMNSIRQRAQDNPLSSADVAVFHRYKTSAEAEATSASASAQANSSQAAEEEMKKEEAATAVEAGRGSQDKGEEVKTKSGEKSDAAKEKKEAAAEEDWRRGVPQQWLQVMETDEEVQAKMEPQPPLSDAYVNGMPPKRRRVAMEERSTAEAALTFEGNLEAALTETRLSLPQPRPATSPALNQAFAQARDELLRRQVAAYADSADPQRFPDACETKKKQQQ